MITQGQEFDPVGKIGSGAIFLCGLKLGLTDRSRVLTVDVHAGGRSMDIDKRTVCDTIR